MEVEFEQALEICLGCAEQVLEFNSVGGGSINDCYRLRTSEKEFFIKCNVLDRYPGMFKAEANGLSRLRNEGEVSVPHVIGEGETDSFSFLLMEYLSPSVRDDEFWRTLGADLAKLHKVSSKQFGLDHDNFIGSLVQSNKEHDRWSEFFINQRSESLLKKARDLGHLGGGDLLRAERFHSALDSLIPPDAASLLHGDLWNGNQHCGADGKPYFIDPAIYFGHREMDIAMSKLFGGFDKAFYHSYQEYYPLESGWEDRVVIHNTYPLLVHTVLFGGGYAEQYRKTIKRFG